MRCNDKLAIEKSSRGMNIVCKFHLVFNRQTVFRFIQQIKPFAFHLIYEILYRRFSVGVFFFLTLQSFFQKAGLAFYRLISFVPPIKRSSKDFRLGLLSLISQYSSITSFDLLNNCLLNSRFFIERLKTSSLVIILLL